MRGSWGLGGWLGAIKRVRVYDVLALFFFFLLLARTRYVLGNEMYNSSLVLGLTHSQVFDMIGSE